MTEFILEKPHPLEVDKQRIPLSFFISTPEKPNNNTIPVVVLHGFGDYANSNYMRSIHSSLTSKYNISIITVNYVGTFSKVKFFYNDSDKPYDFLDYSLNLEQGDNKKRFLDILNGLLNNQSNIIDFLLKNKVIENGDFTPYKRTLKLLIFKIENNSCDGIYIVERLYEMKFKNALAIMDSDTIGDHQDFGVIQAIDILTSLSHIKSIDNYKKLDWSKLSVVGTSHGGYLASMCDKLAPNTFNTILNNAGWLYSMKYEIFQKTVTSNYASELLFSCNENNYWEKDIHSNNFFNKQHKEIRSLINIDHIIQQKEQTLISNNKLYIFSHTLNDEIIPIKDKDNYINIINKYYSNINYIRLDDKDKLDGKTFKTFEHGANVSLKGLVIDFIVNNTYNKSIKQNDFDLKSNITYNCTSGKYIINYTDKYPKISFIKDK